MKGELEPVSGNRDSKLERFVRRLRRPRTQRLVLNALQADQFASDSGFAGALGGYFSLEPLEDGQYVIEAPTPTIERIQALLDESAG